jgi:hypothetical protein
VEQTAEVAATKLSGLVLLALAAGITAAVETMVMVIAGYRQSSFLVICVLVNIASNLSLNLTLSLTPHHWRAGLLPVLEVAVTVAEWAVLRLAVAGPVPPPVRSRPSARLAAVTVAANVASFSLGLALF